MYQVIQPDAESIINTSDAGTATQDPGHASSGTLSGACGGSEHRSTHVGPLRLVQQSRSASGPGPVLAPPA